MNASPFEVCFPRLFDFVAVLCTKFLFGKTKPKLSFVTNFLFMRLMLFSELTMTIEIQRTDLIHLAHVLDPAVCPIFRAISRMAMLNLIQMPMILMILRHRMKAHYPTRDHEHSAHPPKT